MVTKPTGRARGRPKKVGDSFIEESKKTYDSLTAGKRKLRPVLRDIYTATGDPLAAIDGEIAGRVYGLTGAARPSRVLAAIAAQSWGSEARSIASMARHFEQQGLKRRRAIAQAILLGAERDVFIGENGVAVSFDAAVSAVYALIDERLDASIGDTGSELLVKPAQVGAIIPQPDRQFLPLPPEGAWVADTAFWRRLLANGDVEKVDRETSTKKSGKCD